MNHSAPQKTVENNQSKKFRRQYECSIYKKQTIKKNKSGREEHETSILIV